MINQRHLEISFDQALVAGVDEVGRGPLAGPVVAAAVILDPNKPINGLCDSKKMSIKKRLLVSENIKLNSIAWAFGRADAGEIDKIKSEYKGTVKFG